MKLSTSKLSAPVLTALIAALMLAIGATAGSLTPPGAVGSTMHSLANIYDSIASATFDSSGIIANQNGSLMGNLKYIENQMAWASGSNNIWNLNSGNVGIGTIAPTTTFQVAGNASISGNFEAGPGLVSQGLVFPSRRPTFKFSRVSTGTQSGLASMVVQNIASGSFGPPINIFAAQTSPGNTNTFTGTIQSSYFYVEHIGTGDMTGELVAVGGQSLDEGNGGTVTTGIGIRGSGGVSGVGTAILNAVGVMGRNSFTAGKASQSFAIWANRPTLVSSSLITNVGVMVDDMAGGTNNINVLISSSSASLGPPSVSPPSGDWSIYNASARNNYFAGNIGIGTKTPSYKLEIGTPGDINLASAGAGYRIGGNVVLSNQGYENIWVGSGAGGTGRLGSDNVALGQYALYNNNATGAYNTAVGERTLINNTGGSYNTALGAAAGSANLTGNYNSAFGNNALAFNTAGHFNTALGYDAGYRAKGDNNVFLGKAAGYQETGSNTLWIDNANNASSSAFIYGEFDNDILSINANVGIGTSAPNFKLEIGTPGDINIASSGSGYYINGSKVVSTKGSNNTWIGVNTGAVITTGDSNTALGNLTLYSNTTGSGNSAVGRGALSSSGTGNFNVAMGYFALTNLTDDSKNTALGTYALNMTYSGGNNVAVGYYSMQNHNSGGFNTALGSGTLVTNSAGVDNIAIGASAGYANKGSGNVFIGRSAGYFDQGSNALYIENSNVASSSALIYGEFDTNFLRFGATVSISGNVYMNGLSGVDGSEDYMCLDQTTKQVYFGATCTVSSLRFKQNVQDLTHGLDWIERLRPVTFDWKESGKPSLGLIAEEVASVSPLLALYQDGQVLSVNYQIMTAVLAKAIQEQQEMIDALKAGLASGSSQEFTLSGSFISEIFTSIVDLFKSLLGIEFGQGSVRADKVESKQLCVGTRCITEEEFIKVFGTATPEPTSTDALPLPPAPTASASAETTTPTSDESAAGATPDGSQPGMTATAVPETAATDVTTEPVASESVQ